MNIIDTHRQLREVRFQLEQAQRVAVAKEELARQMFLRLVMMGRRVELFNKDRDVSFEEGLRMVDAYLGIADDGAGKPVVQ